MPRTLRVGVVAEDRAWVDLLPPAIQRLAADASASVEIMRLANLHGCSIPRLQRVIMADHGCDVIVVGADAPRPRTTFRKTSDALRRSLPAGPYKLSIAAAEPSVEGWLLSDPEALLRGLEEGLALPLTRPTNVRQPRSEQDAKAILGSFVYDAVGEPVTRNGFEYADLVVARMDLLDSRAPSLRAWAREFHGIVSRA